MKKYPCRYFHLELELQYRGAHGSVKRFAFVDGGMQWNPQRGRILAMTIP